jgi:hypothetical protein
LRAHDAKNLQGGYEVFAVDHALYIDFRHFLVPCSQVVGDFFLLRKHAVMPFVLENADASDGHAQVCLEVFGVEAHINATVGVRV